MAARSCRRGFAQEKSSPVVRLLQSQRPMDGSSREKDRQRRQKRAFTKISFIKTLSFAGSLQAGGRLFL
jgi:hypothetical protein